MNKTAKLSFITAITLVILLAIVSLIGFNAEMREQEILGKNTFVQSMVQADGSVVEYYASGDEFFHYLHDEYGFILMQEGGYLVYATEREGRPYPSDVRFDAAERKIASHPKMSYEDIDFSAHPDLVYDYPTSAPSTLYQSAANSADATVITNIIIYIKFKGETTVPDAVAIDRALNGETNSLFDYYQRLSYGSIVVSNISPYQQNKIYIYEDSQPRSYYMGYKTGTERTRRERTLLNAAVNASKQYLDISGHDLDTDGDNYIDAVNFLVSGTPDGWGELLWPHSWDLDDISGGNPATIGGLKVKKYAFNFLGKLTVGLLAHEFAHVLGVPDLYHYDDNHYPIADWDLMHFEGDTPQFMNAHLRNKYLNVLGEGQIETAEYNGVYSLAPATVTAKNEVLAYRINSPLRSDEYFMVEYRNNNVSVYDSTLPGSGLIIYRICTRVEGNKNAKKNSASSPDEVYIFRPSVVTSGGESAVSRSNLMRAYLSPSNSHFTTLGNSREESSAYYNSKNIYFTNGENSGIVIKAISISDDEITFSINLTGSAVVDEGYFEDKLSVANAKIVNDSFSGVYADMAVTDFDLTKLSDIVIALKDASGEQVALLRLDRSAFVESYNLGTRGFQLRFIVNAKGNSGSFPTVFKATEWLSHNEPKTVVLYVVDADNNLVVLNESPVTVQQMSWETVQMTNISYKTAVAASSRATAVVRKDGKAFISSNNEWMANKVLSDVISIDASDAFILYSSSALRAEVLFNTKASGTDYAGVSDWRNIIKVAATNDTSFGLDLNGKVLYAGNTDKYSTVTSWTGVVNIAAGNSHFAAVLSDGKVKMLGDDTYRQCSDTASWTNITAVSCGDKFTLGLKKDGTVVVAGSLDNSINLSGWTKKIKKITAGNAHIAVIFEDGTVAATGNSEHGQTNLNQPVISRDIIDIAGGYYHTVMVREDGELIYKGVNTNGTNNITGNIVYYNNNYVQAIRIVPPFTEKLLTTGSSYTLKAELYPQNASYKRIVFSSSNVSVVSVTQGGVLEAKSAGTSVITLTHGANSEISAQISVTVAPAITTSVMIAAGSDHSVVLYSNGTVEAAGANTYGQLNVHNWGGMVFIAAAGDTTVGINNIGQLKIAGKLAEKFNVSSYTNIVHVAISENTLVAVNENGTVFAQGDNSHEQITGATTWISGRTVKQAAASSSHILLLDSSGIAYAYGNNGAGQVSALASSNWSNVVKVAAGNGFSIALRKNGDLYYAGKTAFDLAALSNWTDVIDISVSAMHIIGLKADGTVLAIGDNSYLQSNTDSLADVALAAAGGKHTLTVSFDGTVGGKGRNSDSRLVFFPTGEIAKIPLTSLSFAQEYFGVGVGKSIKLQIHLEPFKATQREITFSSGFPAIATVDSSGYVTGHSQGETKITATFKKGNETISITCTVYVYSGSVQSIELVSKPTRRVFYYGEILDLAGGRLKVNVDSQKSFFTEISRDMVLNFSEATTGSERQKDITLRLADKEVSYQIFVSRNIQSVTIKDGSSLKTEYTFGEDIDLAGGYLKISRYGGTSEDLAMMTLHSNGDLEILSSTSDLTTTQVRLRYTEEFIATVDGSDIAFTNYFYLEYNIIVKDQMDKVNVILDKTEYKYGEEIYGSGGVEVHMRSGAVITLPIEQPTGLPDEDVTVTVVGYNPLVLGEQSPKIYVYDKIYNGSIQSDVFAVTVQDSVSSVEITSITLAGALVFDATMNVDYNAKIRVTFAGGYSALAGFENGVSINDNIYPDFSDEGNNKEGKTANITMTVKVKQGEIYIDAYAKFIDVFGLKAIQSLSFVDKRTDVVPFVYKYGEQPILGITINTLGATHHVDIDAAALGVQPAKLGSQEISYSILGKTVSRYIVFNDYVVYITASNTQIEAFYGEEFEISLSHHMASGTVTESKIKSGPGVENIQGYDKLRLGLQNVTVISGDKQLTIQVTVVDVISKITVINTPKTSYELHEDIDLTLLRIELSYRSGATKAVSYTGNEDNFSWSGYDKDIIGKQEITVKYSVGSAAFLMKFTFDVRNKVSIIYVDSARSRSTYMLGESLSLVVICRYENGDMEEIAEYTTDFNSEEIGKRWIQINYLGTYNTSFEVEIVDGFKEIKVTKNPDKLDYLFGEVLDLKGGEVTITTQTGKIIVQPLSAFAAFLTGNVPMPTTRGKQEIILTYSVGDESITASFNVRYAEKSSSLSQMLEASDDSSGVTIKGTYVLFDGSVTYRQLSESLSSYGIIYVRQGGEILSSSDYDIRILRSAKIEVRNTLGNRIEEFSIYIKGDCNGDGIFDESDIPKMASYLAQGINGTEIYTDISGDNKFTILDLALWVARLEVDA